MSGGAGTLNLRGALTTLAGATLTAGTSGSTFNYADTAAAQTVGFFGAGAYNNLHINNTSASGATLGAAVSAANVTGNLRLQTGSLKNGGFAIVGNAAKTFEVAEGAAFVLTGTSAMVTGFGTKTFGAASTVNYAGAAQTVSAETYGDLTISGSSTKTLAGTVNVAGDLNISVGTFDLSTYTANRATAGGTLTVADGATLKIGGTGTLPANYSTHVIEGTSTVEYSGTAQTVSVENYGNLTLSGSGAKTMTGVTAIGGNLKISGTATMTGNAGFTVGGEFNYASSSGTTTLTAATPISIGTFNQSGAGILVDSGNTITVTGTGANTWVKSAGTFTATGSVIFTGAAPQIGAANFNNLTFSGTVAALTTGAITVGGNLTVPSGTSLTVGGYAITVTGTTSVTGTLTHNNATGTKTYGGLVTINALGTWDNSGNSPVTFRGGITLNDTGAFNAGNGTHIFDIASQTLTGTFSIPNVTVTGAAVVLNNSGTLTVSTALAGTGGLTQGPGATLNIGGPTTTAITITTLNASTNPNTVEYDRAGNQTLKGANYYHLVLSGSGVKTLQTGTTTINGNLTLSGAASATTVVGLNIGGNLSIGNGTTFTAAGYALTVTGTTTVGAGTSGNLSISSASGTKIFGGLVTINAGATWSNSGNSAVTFRGGITSSPTFTGGSGVHTFDTASQTLTGTFSIPSVAVTGVTLNNSGTLTVGTALSGTGELAQGPGATLNLGGTAAISTLTATANPNTVNYAGAAQTVNPTTYHDLTLSGSGTKSLAANANVAGTLTVSSGVTLSPSAGVVLNSAGAQGTLTGVGIVQVTVTPGGLVDQYKFSAYALSGLTVDHAGLGVQTVNKTETVGSYGALTTSGASGTRTRTLDGDITVVGALTIGSGTTLDADSTGNYGITVGGNWVGTGTFTPRSGTVTLNGAAQTISTTTTFYHLTLAGSGVKTITPVTTITGNLTLSGTATATMAANLAVGGNLSIGTGTVLATGASYTLGVAGTTSVSGTLTLASTYAKTFTDDVTINAGGVWNETGAASISFGGNLQNDGTLTASSGTHTFTGAAKTLSGVNTITIPSLTVTGTCANEGTLTVATLLTVTAPGTLINNGTITATAALSGTGTLTQGTGATLNLGGTSGITGLDATTNPNTVNYTGAAQTVKATTYDNLTFGGTGGAKSLASGTTVTGNLSIRPSGGTATASVGAGLTLSVGSLTLSGVPALAGTWGGTSSAATYKNSTYFANTTGMLSVLTGSATRLIVTLPGQNFTSGSGNSGSASAQTAGNSFNITLNVVDGGNNIDTSYAGTKTISYSGPLNAPGGATPTYTTTVNFTAGQAAGLATTLPDAGSTTITATDGTLTGVASSTFTVNTEAAIQLGFGTQPANTADGVAITPAVTAEVQDIYGNVVSSTAPITVAIGNNPASGILKGTLTVNAVSGVATFGDLQIYEVGSGYTLTASAASLAGATSSAFDITQAPGDYRSATTGTWATLETWERWDGSQWVTPTAGEGVPTSSSGTIIIRSPHVVTVDAAAGGDQMRVQAGAQITISSGITFTVANGAGTDLEVSGVVNNAGTMTMTGTGVFQSGGKYQHNWTTAAGIIPAATWATDSTCEIVGYTSNTTAPNGLGQSFGNFTWNCASQGNTTFALAGNLATVKGNFTVTSTGAGSGSLQLDTTGHTLTVGGDFTVSAGTLNLIGGAYTVTVNVAGDFSHTGGTITETSTGTGVIVFNGTGTQTYTSGGTVANKINFTVNSGSTLAVASGSTVTVNSTATMTVNGTFDCGTGTAVSGAGTFTLASGATLNVGSAAGITTVGNATGSIQTTTARNFNAAANYIYNGTAGQDTGNGLTTANNLTINNSAGVSLSGNVAVNGTLALTSGALSIGANTLTLNAGITTTGGSLTGGPTSSITFATSAAGAATLPAVSGGLLDLTVNRTAGITLGGAVSVGGTLTLTVGTLSDGGNTLTLADGATIIRNNTAALAAAPVFSGLVDVTYTGTANATTGLEIPTDTTKLRNLTQNNTGTITLSTAITVNGDLTIASSAVLDASTSNFGISLAGNWINNATGGFTARSGTVTFIGSGAKSIGGSTLTTFYNLTLSGSSGVTTARAVTVGGNLDVGSGTTFTIAGFDTTVTGTTTVSGTLIHSSTTGVKTFNGDVVINSTGNWNETAATAVSFAGNLQNNGTFTALGGTHTFSVNNKTIGGAHEIAIPSVSISNTRINDGVLTVSTTLTGGTLQQGTSATLNFSGSSINSTLTAIATGNTVNYAGVAQTVKNTTYHNLTLSGSGTKTLGGAIVVNSDITISLGVTLDANSTSSYGISVAGNWSNSGTFTPRSGTVTFNGNSAQSLAGATTFYNLTVNNGGAGLSLSADQTVNAALTFAAGKITTGAYTLILGTAGTVATPGTGKYVFGNLQKNFLAGTQAFTFPIGDSTDYEPLAVTSLVVNTGGGNLMASTTPGSHPQLASSGINSIGKVNHYWTLTAVSGTYGTYGATFTYLADEAGGTPASYIARRWDGSAWSPATVSGTPTSTATLVTGVSGFGDFAIGDVAPVAVADSFSRQQNISLKILKSDLLANDTGTGISFTSVDSSSAQGATLTASGSFVFYTPNSAGDGDTFTYTISDTYGATTTGTVTITVAQVPVGIDPSHIVVDNDAKTVTLNLAGIPGYTYVIERTFSLSPPPVVWVEVDTPTAPDAGVFTVIDSFDTMPGAVYYRMYEQ